MRIRKLLASGVLALSLTLAACASPEPEPREITSNVAVLFSSYADIWTTAGGEVAITVGEAVERGFAEPDVVLVDSGAGHSSIDLETLVAAEPSLVIGTADYECQRTALARCEELGIPTMLLRVESFDDYLDALEHCCELTGQSENYVKYGLELRDKIDEILASRSGGSFTYLHVRAGSSARSTKPKSSEESFVAHMLDELGGENLVSDELIGELSLEAIVEGQPDFLFITTMGNEAAAVDYMESELRAGIWQRLDCVREGKFAFLERELFHFKPNSRWSEAYATLAELLR